MRLIIVHYHLRPGGIRRIIELATPHLLKALAGRIDEVVLATGEADDLAWNNQFRKRLQGVRVTFFTDRAFGYISDQRAKPGIIAGRIREGLKGLLNGANPEKTVIWMHNAGIARNLLLNRELFGLCERLRVPLLAHHHDWWFDNRWLRWPEIRKCGFRTLADAARVVFPGTKLVRHAAINHSDASRLKRHLRQHVFWIPNLTEPGKMPGRDRLGLARRWSQAQVREKGAPIWIVPCRLLRRKNLAEALLLKELLRPEAWLLTTGSPSSNDEIPYARKLEAALQKQGWRMKTGILAGKKGAPEVTELIAASECVLLTSIQEGFGLPYLEASAVKRPLIARFLPNIAPDLKKFGFHFPQYYDELLVPLDLLNAHAERHRQLTLFRAWKSDLPGAVRKWVEEPKFLQSYEASAAVTFSRLTLTAQIEILRLGREILWNACAPLNPFLQGWAKRAGARQLECTPWPHRANDWLTGPAYGKRWARALQGSPDAAPSQREANETQIAFIQWKLRTEHLYPLLWARET